MASQAGIDQKKLLQRARTLTRDYQFTDLGPGGGFAPSLKTDFQHLAQDISAVIKAIGIDKTDKSLLSVAREVQKLDAAGYNDTSFLGRAFALGLKKTSDKKTPANPFRDLSL